MRKGDPNVIVVQLKHLVDILPLLKTVEIHVVLQSGSKWPIRAGGV